MGIEDDDEKEDEADEHVDDGEDPVDAGLRVDVGEVVDGGDERVPWEEEPETQREVDYVREMERVFWDFVSGSSSVAGFRLEEGVFRVAGFTHLRYLGSGSESGSVFRLLRYVFEDYCVGFSIG